MEQLLTSIVSYKYNSNKIELINSIAANLSNLKGAILLFILFLYTWQLNAQKNEPAGLVNGENPTYSISFIGNGLKNPGLNFRYEFPLSIKQITEPKRKIKALYINGDLGFYWDPYTHIATYATAGVLYRRTYKKNFQTVIGLNPLGFQHHFLHEVYEVGDDLEIEYKKLAGQSYYAPKLILGLGKLKKSKASFFSIHIMILRKYNLGTFPNINFEFGYRF